METFHNFNSVKNQLNKLGFCIAHPFNTAWYNKFVDKNSKKHKNLVKLKDDRYAILIGNTKTVWSFFKSWIKTEPIELSDPFDKFVEISVSSVFKDLKGKLYWGHETKDYLVALQQIADCSGFAYLDTDLHLCIHQKYGTWFSLRAVYVFENVACEQAQPTSLRNPLTTKEKKRVKEVIEEIVQAKWKVPWTKWVELRSIPLIGKEYKFEKEQLKYHYAKTLDA